MTSSHPVRRRNNTNNNNNSNSKDVSQLMLLAAEDDGDNNGSNNNVSTSSIRLARPPRRKRGASHNQQHLPSSLPSSFFTAVPACRRSLMDSCSSNNSSKTWIFIFVLMTTLQALVIVVLVRGLWPQNASAILTKRRFFFTSNHHFWISPPPLAPSEEEEEEAVLHRYDHGIRPQTPTTAALLRFNRPLETRPVLDNQSLSMSNRSEPLDDYYSRPHIRVSLKNSTTSSSSSNNEEDAASIFQQLPVLIIGGSDGSGTRAFVDMLGKLGVPMLADDGGTLDVHAAGIMNGHGWPPLVQAILMETHQQAANYSSINSSNNLLSESTRQLAMTELGKLKQRFEMRALQLRKRGIARNISLSKLVAYGYKAPVTMLLLPLLVQVFGKVKFVHVLRDGRDVALSDNGSPVIKFYHSYYHDNAEPRIAELQQQQWGGGEEHDKMAQNVQAMQLWNDWNVQVYEYCRQRNDGVQLDYLPIRTEDLLDESTKLASLIQLSDFVGSMQTAKQLCCKSRLKIVDMGGSNEKMGRRGLPLPASGGDSKHNYKQRDLGWWGHIFALFSWVSTSSTRPDTAPVATFGRQHLSSEFQKRRQPDTDPIEDLNDEADIPMESVFLEQLKLQQQQHQQQQQQQQNGRLDRLANRIGGRGAARDGHAHHGWQRQQQNMDTTIHVEAAAESIHGRRLLAGHDQININSLLPAGLLPHHREMSDADAELFRNAMQRKQETMYRETMVEETPAAEKNLRKDLLNRWDNTAKREQDPWPLEDEMSHHHSIHHHHHRAGTADDVKKRYGKWEARLEGKPAFSALLHQQGARGLQLFGYEPNRIFADSNVPPQLSSFPCDATVQCSKEDGALLMIPSTTR